MKKTFRLLAMAAMAAAAGCAVTATEAAAPAAPPMTEEQMMQKMAELATPGAAHKRLEPLIGNFKTKGTFWMTPGAPPTTTEGKAVQSWLFDGRFVKQEYTGTFEGQPFSGLGITGYDNADGLYHGIWIDSMGTMMMPVSSGKVDASGKVITFKRRYHNVMAGGDVTSREVLTITDADHHTYEWHEPGPDGKEFLMFRIEYTRAK